MDTSSARAYNMFALAQLLRQQRHRNQGDLEFSVIKHIPKRDL